MATKKTAQAKKGASKKMTGMEKAEIGAGVLATLAAAGAAGYYFYGSKDAKKHRTATAKWATGLKKDVIREAKKLKQLDEAAMAAIVDEASKAYKGMQDVTPADLKAAVAELKSNWENVRKELRRTGSKSAASAKKTVKKAAPKKAPAKAAKKAPAKKK
jgi:hypothetical protein